MRRTVLAFLALAWLLVGGSAYGSMCSFQGYACWVCEDLGGIANESACALAAGDSWGTGTGCHDCEIWGSFCYTTGPDCYYIEAGGGSGTGGGPGAGGGCTVSQAGFCPASCFVCLIQAY